MSPVIPLLTVFLSGLFGLLVAYVSNRMSAGKDTSQHNRQKATDHYEEIKSLYAEHLSTLHLITTHTVNHLDETPLLSAFSSQDSKLALLSTPAVIAQSDLMVDLLQRWAKEYNAGYPPGMTIAHGGENRKAAADLSKEIDQERAKLIEVMRAHLDTLRASI